MEPQHREAGVSGGGRDHRKKCAGEEGKACGYEFVVGTRRPDARVLGRTPRDLHSIPALLANVKNVSEWLSLECRALVCRGNVCVRERVPEDVLLGVGRGGAEGLGRIGARLGLLHVLVVEQLAHAAQRDLVQQHDTLRVGTHGTGT